jgi:hypothetical protein
MKQEMDAFIENITDTPILKAHFVAAAVDARLLCEIFYKAIHVVDEFPKQCNNATDLWPPR